MPSRSIDFGKPIPLFPLASCVLMPHATVPLHVFEPRYRVMTRDAIDGDRLIAMATFGGDDWKAEYAGNPPIRDVVCVGFRVRHHQLPDGRYNLLLQGVCRAKVEEEWLEGPYRIGQLEPIEAEPPMEIDLEEPRKRLERLLGDASLTQLASINSIRNWLSAEIPTPTLVDLAILSVTQDREDRYAMLAEADVVARATWLEHHLQQMRHTCQIAERIGASKTDDGMNLN